MTIFATLLALAAQAAPPPATRPGVDDPAAFAAEIAETHGSDAYYKMPAVRADVLVEFGGQIRHDGPMWFLPPAHVTRLEGGGQTIVFNESAHVSPAAEADPGDRFAALTWPYFLAAPFKLQDEGANLADGGLQPLTGEPEPAVRLTFGAGVGDAPDDWYLAWKDDQGRLAALAYIVTYFPGREPEPHVAVYDEYQTVDGVALPKRITFYDWSADRGAYGEPLGKIEIRKIEFADPPEGAFDPPPDSAEVPLPGGA